MFTKEFLGILADAGVISAKLPARSRNLNYSERFVRSIEEFCLERLILFGEASVRKATAEFVKHYHLERNHQGLAIDSSTLTRSILWQSARQIDTSVSEDCSTTITAVRHEQAQRSNTPNQRPECD